MMCHNWSAHRIFYTVLGTTDMLLCDQGYTEDTQSKWLVSEKLLNSLPQVGESEYLVDK